MSKQVADRESASRAVIDAIIEHEVAITAKHVELLGGAASRLGTPIPEVGALLRLYAETLRFSVEKLTKASAAHAIEGLDDAAPRDRRDKAERALRDFLSPMRKAVEGVFGDQGLRAIGLWEQLPSSTEVLRKYAEGVVDGLAQPGLSLTPLLSLSGPGLDPAAYLAGLRPLVTTLSHALEEVSKEAAELGGTKLAKDAAMKEHNASFIRIAGAVEQLARVAGLDELAQRIRPSASDPGVLIEARDNAPGDPIDPDKPAPGNDVKPGMPGADPFAPG